MSISSAVTPIKLARVGDAEAEAVRRRDQRVHSGQGLGVVNYEANHPEHLKIELGGIWFGPVAQDADYIVTGRNRDTPGFASSTANGPGSPSGSASHDPDGPTCLASHATSGRADSSSERMRDRQAGVCSQGSSGWRRYTVISFMRSRSMRGWSIG